MTQSIERRYGRTPERRRRDRWLLGGGLLAVLVVVGAWVIWVGGANSQANLEATDTAFTIRDAHHVDISFTINAPVGQPVTCALQALNEDFAIVGWRVIEYPGSDTRVTKYTETIRTVQQSNTGLINTCWLT
ncbi:DUF4307 domain-containing protein [Leifsonia sp. F6_8S_P_1B]|uniref:DUF4307 domain-containing protein n=1 Tax=Leifsonia williamsii TaxID=3035919 RepID=A0ABT8KEC7_9MICO|nr:DUF4307 domain-containing protein [Leifsonia williamsii]MDN4615815.1 DUF4307 domain-containing protein [Leifsonia williamsii]